MSFLSFGFRIYKGRYVECDSKELLSTLQWIFDADFPEDIKEVKTAKTINHDGAILYIVKFAGEPNTIDRFLDSFENKLAPEDYSSELDDRGSLWPFTPGWFKEPIKQGKITTVKSIRGTIGFTGYMYIDTVNEKSFVVYLEGSYADSYAQQLKE